MKSRNRRSNLKLVSTSLLARILHPAHCFLLAGNPVERRMYDSIRRECYRPHMVSGIYTVLNTRTECSCMGTTFRYQRKLELFPPADSLEFVAVGILGRLQRTKGGS